MAHDEDPTDILEDSIEVETSIGGVDLFPHQITAVRWMMVRERDTEFCGGLLCDEMGLGKTLSVCGLLVNAPVPSTLLLGPLAVLEQWIAALKKIGVVIYTLGVRGWMRRKGGGGGEATVYVANYDKLMSKKKHFDIRFDRLIADEAHIIRNYDSKKYKALKRIKIQRKWFLTGTPVVNNKKDVATLVSLLNHKVLAHYTPTDDVAYGWMSKLALARSVEQLRGAAPHVLPAAPIVKTHRLEFSTNAEATFYRGIQGRLEARALELMEQDRGNSLLFLKLILRLRQISVHPQIYINALRSEMRREMKSYTRGDWKGDSTKVEKLVGLMEDDAMQPRGFVIFCHFRDEMALLEARLKLVDSVASVYSYHGGLTASQRSDVVEATRVARDKADGHVVLLAQMHTAGTGLNLQHMDRVVFTSSWWTAALMDQAVGRVVRLGQKNQVIVHNIMFDEEADSSLNIDDFIQERVDSKRELCAELLNAADHSI